MRLTGVYRLMCAGIVSASVTAFGADNSEQAPDGAAPGSSPTASRSTASPAPAGNPDNRCPLTVEQVAVFTGQPMMFQGACTFFAANGRDIPHVFYVLQVPMLCNSIKPNEMGFVEPVDGLSARSAYIRDQIDGSHVLVCPNNGRAFDVVVDMGNDKAKNRAAAIRLAKQLLATK